MHYYQSQQQENFTTKAGKAHLRQLKQQAMAQVVNDAYVKQLARQNHVSVSTAEVNDEVALVRSQNRLGSNDQVFRSVLNEFWGWTVSDFQRELRQQLLQQKLTAKLNTQTEARANAALTQLKGGADFATVAGQASDDPSTKGNGGNYGIAIDESNRDIAPEVANQLFKLAPGQYSGIIQTSYGLEIVKVIDSDGSKVHAAHMQFNFKPISEYVKPVQDKNPSHQYIKTDLDTKNN
jgi:parvulin-like peptidyl-prolyl isomerase